MQDLIGKSFTFPDGDKIEVIQIKPRDEGAVYVTIHITQGPGIPRKIVLSYPEFQESYGHLFGHAPNSD